MNSGTVHLIATDPPFNKNRDFHATPDSISKGAKFKDRWRWEEDIHEEWVDQIQDDWPATWAVIEASKQAFGSDMAAFLCWLGVRLMEMHRVLRDDGSIYLHIDHTAHAYVKTLMDSIFGRENFRNEIVWHYGKMSNTSRNFPSNHDTILRYTKSDTYTFHPLKGGESEYRERFKRYLKNNKILYGAVKNSRDKLILGRAKKVSKELGRQLVDSDVLFDFDKEYKIQSDVIYVSIIKGNSSENMNYPTQKPVTLYNKLVTASSNPRDIVLDPFCGCATTPVVAETLGRQWVGMDIWEGAHKMVMQRLVQEGLATNAVASDRLITFGDVTLRSDIPTRTDDNEVAAPKFELRTQRAADPWQRLANKTIKNILAEAQKAPNGKIWCAGCGRSLEIEFMHLDHILPKSDRGDNFITNRVLLCGPCNMRKGDKLTMRGLHGDNKKQKWMANETRAKDAGNNARDLAYKVKDEWGSMEIELLKHRAVE
ncbi:MAG: DNA methyltransferase [bacterium]|nr:DNA methyltransferase [bacterium]